MSYRRRASPLHAARAAAGCAYCLALAAAALLFDHPLMLAAVLAAVLAAALLAGVGEELRRVARLAVPLAVFIALLDPLLDRNGITLIFRGGAFPLVPGGRLDITLEACGWGAMFGLRVLAVTLACGLYAAAVDPDEVLRLFRRVSFRSALTAALATRMLPVLRRDASRLAEAQRCRPGAPPSRVAVVRAVAAGALDRAVDVAATLEVRGYGAARRAPRGAPPWSRHDVAFLAAAVAVVALAAGGRIAGLAEVTANPRLHLATGVSELVLAAAIVLVALLPFAERRGIAR
jgi:energy-coupling factor transport system permease protein